MTEGGVNHWVVSGVNHWAVGGVNHWAVGGVNHWAVGGVNHWAMSGVNHWAMSGVNHWAMSGLNHWAVSGVRGLLASPCTLKGSRYEGVWVLGWVWLRQVSPTQSFAPLGLHNQCSGVHLVPYQWQN